jgi:hypothetical protein
MVTAFKGAVVLAGSAAMLGCFHSLVHATVVAFTAAFR